MNKNINKQNKRLILSTWLSKYSTILFVCALLFAAYSQVSDMASTQIKHFTSNV